MRRKHNGKIDLIRRLPSFSNAPANELKQLATAADVITAPAGELLCRADRRGFETFVVVDGVVDVRAGSTLLASLGRGQIVGELGVIDRAPRSADVIAATDVTVLVFPARRMRALLDTNRSLRSAVLQQLAARVRRADASLTQA